MPTCCLVTTRLNVILLGTGNVCLKTLSERIAVKYNLEQIPTDYLLNLTKESREKLYKNRNIQVSDVFVRKLFPAIPDNNFIIVNYPEILSHVFNLPDIDLVLVIENNTDCDLNNNTKHIENDFVIKLTPVIQFYEHRGILEKLNSLTDEEDMFAKVTEIVFKRFNIK